ncbi:MAG: hypothetical protein Q4G52_01045 [Clostridia bacterium]|nr:hypothetical protein [Clostridia bacterium]
MSLFGRRKPGFSKEVELRPEDISDEFSDRNDPAMARNSNPKEEKAEMAARAQAVMDGTAVSAAPAASGERQAAQSAEKVDLFDYMDSLPEVEDPFTPSEDPMVPDPEAEAEKEQQERKPAELLAQYIRHRSMAAQLTPKKPLAEEEPQLEEMLAEMRAMESCQDIASVTGKKDEYFYSNEVMANNYAMIAMLVLEKDLATTVAHMVRFNCKTYPSPTPLYYFMRSPYDYTKPQLDQALRVIQSREDTQDIKTVESFNGVLYMYAEGIMSRKYAKALADDGEADEGDF